MKLKFHHFYKLHLYIYTGQTIAIMKLNWIEDLTYQLLCNMMKFIFLLEN